MSSKGRATYICHASARDDLIGIVTDASSLLEHADVEYTVEQRDAIELAFKTLSRVHSEAVDTRESGAAT